MYAQLHFDPEQGKFVEVYPVMPGTCNFCHCPINAYAVINFQGCCSDCWDTANEYERQHQHVND